MGSETGTSTSHISLTALSLQPEVSKSLPSFRLETTYSHSWESLVHGRASSALPWSKPSPLQTRSAGLNSCSAALR